MKFDHKKLMKMELCWKKGLHGFALFWVVVQGK